MTNLVAALPMIAEPSWRTKVGVIAEPQEPLATNENVTGTPEPPAGSTPRFCGALGEVTPGPCSVATRFVVFAVPTFCTLKFNETISPGSIALFVGAHPSEARTVLGTAITGTLVATAPL